MRRPATRSSASSCAWTCASRLRRPGRYRFQRETGDLWLGDVGEDRREEVNFVPAGTGGGQNFGWRCMEGFKCTGMTGCACNNVHLTMPVVDWTNAGNCSVIGGYVYRGCAIPELRGW